MGESGVITTHSLTHSPSYWTSEHLDLWSLADSAMVVVLRGRRCILLELTVGHEVFCDQWMPAYNYELLQEPKAFEAKLLDCLCALEFFMRDHLHLAPERVDFILGLLTVDPAKR